jgi:hypothetical protein
MAGDLRNDGDSWEVLSAPESHEAVLAAIQKAGIPTVSAELAMIPKNLMKLEGKAASGRQFSRENPADIRQVATVAEQGTLEDTRAAIDAARAAFDSNVGNWIYNYKLREQALFRTARLIRDNADRLARVVSLEVGMPKRQAVLAHEVTHIVNRDVAIMTMASFFASIASMIVQFGFFFGGGMGGNSDNDDDNPSFMVVLLVSVAVYVISFLLMQALSRYREFAADRGAAVITGRPSALSSALLKISGSMQRTPTQDLRAAGELNAFFIVPAVVKNSITGLFATHPPMEKRIEALSRLEAQLQSGARPVAA